MKKTKKKTRPKYDWRAHHLAPEDLIETEGSFEAALNAHLLVTTNVVYV